MHDIRSATVVGSGVMGPGIATNLALGGVKATILARTELNAAKALDAARALLLLLESDGLITPEQSTRAASLVDASHHFTQSLTGRDLVIESIPEDMQLKQDFFAQIEPIVGPDCWITTNTSGLSITVMSSKTLHPERFCTTHFWNPPHLIPLVEIVRTIHTKDEVVQGLKSLLERCGKVPVIVKKDRPGQLGNRLQMAMVREAVNIIAEGIADVEDVDRAASLSFGLRLPVYGIFEHQDLVGRDAYRVCDYVSGDLYNEPQAPPFYRAMFENGKLGTAPGCGFYDWTKKDATEVKAHRDLWLREFLKGPFGKSIRPKN